MATIARLALFNSFSEQDIADLMKAFSISRLRTQMAALGLCEADADDRYVARLYFSGRCRIISPNAFFDETWYCDRYAEVARAIKAGTLVSGFVHFMKYGIKQGLWPNEILHAQAASCTVPELPSETVDADIYLSRYPGAAAFLAAFPSVTAQDHYNLYGRFLGYSLDSAPKPTVEAFSLRVAEAEFDPVFYRRRYLGAAENAIYRDNPFDHYVKIGMKAAYSPNAWFQEDWYRAYYKEVRDAIETGMVPSGFYHYLLSGRIEGRMAKFDLGSALEARMPGVTQPVLLSRTEMLRTRLAGLKTLPTRAKSANVAQSIWIFLPTLNPDIMYGGYKAVIELICALHRDGCNVVVVCLEEEPNEAYFLWSESSARIRQVFSQIKILNLEKFARSEVGRSDIFVAYTVWDLPICEQLVQLTDNHVPLLLAQEHEPIFYDNGAQRALCESCYRIRHYPIINSAFLKSYFAKNRIGVFMRDGAYREWQDYAVFEHKINRLPSQTASAMRGRRSRVMAIYARPEAHAARNLFEVVLIALRQLCANEVFSSEWRFIGLGALTKMPPIALGGGHELQIRQKMSEQDYLAVMAEMDIGISLMYAPHPSVVPFEFATTGAIVITNTYENRSAEDLRGICRNIVPCEISIDSVVDTIRRAMRLVDNFEQRERQALRPKMQSWDEIFSSDFIQTILAAVTEKPTGTADHSVGATRPRLTPASASAAPELRARSSNPVPVPA